MKKQKEKRASPFDRAAMLLYKQACIRKLPLFASRQVERDLLQLHPGENIQCVKTEYYVKKLSMVLMILLLGGVFGAAAKVSVGSGTALREDGSILRGSYQEGIREIQLETSLDGETQEFQVELWPKHLAPEETEELADRLLEELPELIRGENEDLRQISKDLLLYETYEGYPFTVTWESSRPDLIGISGAVNVPDTAAQVELSAEFGYEEYARTEVLTVSVVPLPLTPQEQSRRELEDYLLYTEQNSRADSEWSLPSSWQGSEIQWSQKVEDNSLLLWAAALAVAVLVYMMSDHDLHRQIEKRRRFLLQEYPDLVHQLALFVGAGMTVGGAFRKVAGDYERRRDKMNQKSPAYEEMLRTCRELQTGVSEGAAYEHFGRRTGQQEYIKLSTLLMQNLKRGNSSLLERLREEADKAAEERLFESKRQGEEASTKLLAPMVMMLAVVMIMIMVPAFSSM